MEIKLPTEIATNEDVMNTLARSVGDLVNDYCHINHHLIADSCMQEYKRLVDEYYPVITAKELIFTAVSSVQIWAALGYLDPRRIH